MHGIMDLDKLRLRLTNLGVDVGLASAEKNKPAKRKPQRHRDPQTSVLDVAEKGQNPAFPDSVEGNTIADGLQETERKDGKYQEGKRPAARSLSAGQKDPAGNQLRTGQRLASRCKNISTPLGSVLAQYKQAEEHWTREKAGIRREGFMHRKRANQLALENKKLAAINHHKSLDIKALKSALRNRDAQLQSLQKKSSEMESVLAENHEMASQQFAEMSCERDELRALLAATLKRLEAVDEFVQKTAASSTFMEERLKAIEAERLKALSIASKSEGLQKELNGTRKQLFVQKEMLQKMSDIQLKKNRKQQKAIRSILKSTEPDPNPMSAVASWSDETGEGDDDDHSERIRKEVHAILPHSIQGILEG